MDEYTEITGFKPTTISSDGEQIRLILRTRKSDLRLEFQRERFEDLVEALIQLSEAASVNSALQLEKRPDVPRHLNAPALFTIRKAAVVVGPQSVLIRWGPQKSSGQINIYGEAFNALRTALSSPPAGLTH